MCEIAAARLACLWTHEAGWPVPVHDGPAPATRGASFALVSTPPLPTHHDGVVPSGPASARAAAHRLADVLDTSAPDVGDDRAQLTLEAAVDALTRALRDR